jgi:centromere protein I
MSDPIGFRCCKLESIYHRIQLSNTRSLELARNVGEERPLLGLIRVYKDYYPDVIVGNTTKGRVALFHHPDRDWQRRLQEIQEAHARTTEGSTVQRSSFKVVRRGLNGIKRNKISGVPEVHTSRANEVSKIQNTAGSF